jgi:cytochrome P450
MSAATMAFYHALYLFPEVAQKVYDEIQAITDGTRLPTLKDRENMPYTVAVWKEVLRWKPFLPLSKPLMKESMPDDKLLA